jgi:pathogenesis-related protein 1
MQNLLWAIAATFYFVSITSGCYDFTIDSRDAGSGTEDAKTTDTQVDTDRLSSDNILNAGHDGSGGIGGKAKEVGTDGGQAGEDREGIGSTGMGKIDSGVTGTIGSSGDGGGIRTTNATGTGGISGNSGQNGIAGGAFGGTGGDPESGRLAGITAAHNSVRANVQTQLPLPPLTWSVTLARYAQEWSNNLASTCNPQNRNSADLQAKDYGENLAMFAGIAGSPSTAQTVVDGWAKEAGCWTYGKFFANDKCDKVCYEDINSDSCNHYTQIVWRNTKELGCGLSTCNQNGMNIDIWVCNYSPAGNYVGEYPY